MKNNNYLLLQANSETPVPIIIAYYNYNTDFNAITRSSLKCPFFSCLLAKFSSIFYDSETSLSYQMGVLLILFLSVMELSGGFSEAFQSLKKDHSFNQMAVRCIYYLFAVYLSYMIDHIAVDISKMKYVATHVKLTHIYVFQIFISLQLFHFLVNPFLNILLKSNI